MSDEKKDDYSLKSATGQKIIAAPDLPYSPQDPKNYRPNIGLIACGGITQWHLTAYKKAGYTVVALCDLVRERAEKRRHEFYPEAFVTTDYREILARDDIEVVDIATHPPERLPLIEAALNAGKHVLSQKPFVLDLDQGERLIQLAAQKNVRFAVNQNGRWAPHLSYLREAVKSGILGKVIGVHCGVHWDHSWTKGTPFEKIYDLVFYDFAIHWFDFAATIIGERPVREVFGMRGRADSQPLEPPLLAQALIGFEGGQSSLVFDAYVRQGPEDRTYIAGTAGTITSVGADLSSQVITLHTAAGIAKPTLTGAWFPDGFHGSMGELLRAIEENREPTNSARNNLKSLALCFAGIASANDHRPYQPGDVRRLPEGSIPEKMGA